MSAGRADRAAALAAERGLDAVLVNEPVNVRYLTGFSGTNGLALVGSEGLRRFLTDFRYVERAAAEVDGFERLPAERDLVEGLPGALGDGRPLRLGFDDAHVSVRLHARLAELLGDGVELVPAGGLVEELRAVKDPDELDRIRAAAALADEAFAAALERGLAGRAEREVARDIEDGIRDRGAEPAFPAIVAAGPHGAQPHAESGDQPIPGGTLVVVDWGARLDGYCSDCTRTLATGQLDGEAIEVYDLVLRAQEAGLEALSAGPTGREVDAAARALIDEAGHGERFGHGLGHGVGMEVHEGPRLTRTADEPLRPGNVVTVEPGIYLSGRFGVRIEDLVAVTKDGREVISGEGKELRTVG